MKDDMIELDEQVIEAAFLKVSKTNWFQGIYPNIPVEQLRDAYEFFISDAIFNTERYFFKENIETHTYPFIVYCTWFDHFKATYPKITKWIPKRWREAKYTTQYKQYTLQINYPYSGITPERGWIEGKRLNFARHVG